MGNMAWDFTIYLVEKQQPDHLLPAEERGKLSDVLWPLAASCSSSHIPLDLSLESPTLLLWSWT